MSEQPHPTACEGFPVRCGQVRNPGERSFWFIGRKREDFEAARDLVAALMDRYPRLDIVFTAPGRTTRQWLREAFPRVLVLPPPLPFATIANRYLMNLNVRCLMILGDLATEDRPVLRAANRRAIPAAIGQAAGPQANPDVGALGAVPERLDHHFVTAAGAAESLAAAGIARDRITLLAGTPAERTAATITVLARLLMQDLKLNRSSQRPIRRRLEALALWSMEQPRLRRLLARRIERLDDIRALGRALGDPQTILCLGNGPSSEDPAVAAVDYDCLFRVNHSWLPRGFLTEPDMVFTGSKSTLALVKGAIFGLQSIKSEARLLATRLLQPYFGLVRYATIERFALYLTEPRWEGVRPTNGAAMLAVAVALQPARLVIAGIDLFSHPAGTYPGDTATPNAYSPGHEAESELALLMAALSLYQGELVILSPALQERWDEHRSGRQGLQGAV
ncbi:MAG: glycosyltransferase N-terminal domain-containing protein [Kiloniellaceae bacterium]